MRITIRDGERTVSLETGKHSRVHLREAEESALRMLAALPGPPGEPAKQEAFGFSLSADTERADPIPEPYDDEE
ncbi:hypothetical protein [Streptomyces sp. NPDC059076]|uniref:hypothetical protein n=1 Tax=unclassified Streptomyces TaxID=2593676 RepID=UPI0036CF610C